ncbi:MAG: hypothetical protein WBX15_19675 [Thermoanaerobaculia bacterium]
MKTLWSTGAALIVAVTLLLPGCGRQKTVVNNPDQHATPAAGTTAPTNGEAQPATGSGEVEFTQSAGDTISVADPTITASSPTSSAGQEESETSSSATAK